MPIFLHIYGLTFFSLSHDLVHEPFHLCNATKPTAMRTALRSISKPSAKRKAKVRWEDLPELHHATARGDMIVVALRDGRVVQFPAAWSKLLAGATLKQRKKVRVAAWHLFWDELDEVISIEQVLYGDKLNLS